MFIGISEAEIRDTRSEIQWHILGRWHNEVAQRVFSSSPILLSVVRAGLVEGKRLTDTFIQSDSRYKCRTFLV